MRIAESLTCAAQVRPLWRLAHGLTFAAALLTAPNIEFSVHFGAAPVAAAERVEWFTGRDLERQLPQPVTLIWAKTPLRDALTTLSRNQRVAIVFDRRVDPDQLLKFQATQEPLEIVLQRLADQLGLGSTRLGNVFYIGPRDTAGKLRTLSALLRDEIAKQPAATRGALSKVEIRSWDDLAEPRELLRSLARSANVEFTDLEAAVPHDLWAAADLPPLAWHDRALLIAAQFDRTLHWAAPGRNVQLIAIPAVVSVERSYSPGKDAQATLARYRELAPDAQIELAGGKIVVRGRVEEHERLAPTGPGVPAAPVKGGIDVYSLTLTDVPLDKLLSALEGRLGLKFQYDPTALQKAGIKLNQRISFKVEQKPLDDLLRAALEPAGLMFKRTNMSVEVFPKAGK